MATEAETRDLKGVLSLSGRRIEQGVLLPALVSGIKATHGMQHTLIINEMASVSIWLDF